MSEYSIVLRSPLDVDANIRVTVFRNKACYDCLIRGRAVSVLS